MKQIIFIAMPMYSLMEHINIYSDISRSLWKFKRDDVSANNANWVLLILIHLNIKHLL